MARPFRVWWQLICYSYHMQWRTMRRDESICCFLFLPSFNGYWYNFSIRYRRLLSTHYRSLPQIGSDNPHFGSVSLPTSLPSRCNLSFDKRIGCLDMDGGNAASENKGYAGRRSITISISSSSCSFTYHRTLFFYRWRWHASGRCDRPS